jgi:hypothetical protein
MIYYHAEQNLKYILYFFEKHKTEIRGFRSFFSDNGYWMEWDYRESLL